MKAIVDIIYREPKSAEPGKPGIFSLINVAAIIYLLYLFDKGLRLSNIDLFLIPVFILAIGLQVILFLKKKRE